MKQLETTAHRFGLQRRGMAAPLSVLMLLLALTLVVAGCGKEGRADTGDSETTAEATNADADASEEGKDSEGEDGEDDETIAIPVSVAAVEQGAVSAYLTATANLVAENEVKVLGEAEGRVERLLVDEGHFVRKGQLLATLVSDDQRIALAKAEIQHANAELGFERGEDLSAKELLSREDMDKLLLELEIAEQELAEAKWQVQKTEIRAPFAGQISERLIQLGQHVRNGDELFQITDFDPLIARIYFPETDVIGLENGREVRLSLNADPDMQFEGRIRHVSNVVDVSTGTVKITVEVAHVPAGVRPGSFVTVGIVRETRNDVLKLPKEAVIRELRSAHVFVVQDNLAQKREVTLGLEEGDFVEALSGVDTGERVIVLGQGGLKNGSEIEILTPTGEDVRES